MQMKTFSKVASAVALLAFMSSCQDHDLDGALVQDGLSLTSGQEVPPNTSPGMGTANISYDRGTRKLSYTVEYKNLTAAPMAGHIHGSAPRGENSAVLFPFTGLPVSNSGRITGTADVPADKVEDLYNGLFYINLHTPMYPGGEIRGQIEFYALDRNVMKRDLPMVGSQEVPATPSKAYGAVDVNYNKKTKRLSYNITWNGLAAPITGAHIHGIAGRGMNAAVVHPFTDKIPKEKSGNYSGSVMVDEVNIKEADLLAGKYYFNLHNSEYPMGEIRAQIEF